MPFVRTSNVAAAGAFVQQSPVSIGTGNTNKQTATLPTAATADNLLVVVCSVGTSATVSVSGYSTAAASASGTVSQGVFYKIAAGGETSAQCDSSVRTKSGVGAHMYEYSGINTLSPLDVSGTASGTGTAVSSGSATPTSTSSLVFTAYTAAGGASFSGITAGYTKRADTLSGIHLAQADLFTTASTAQSASLTNATSAAWRGQIAIFRVALGGTKTADIVDGTGAPVASPSITFAGTNFDLGCDTTVATLGTASEMIRISNTTPTPTWSISIAATNGETDFWSGGGNKKYDYNDTTVDGCTDGADSDSLAGKMIVDPTTGTITPSAGCSNTGVSLGSSLGFSEGSQESVLIASADGTAETGCDWDITGVSLIQYLPPEQDTGTYTFSLTLTLLAI